MAGLVLELQRDAMDSSISVAGLLRKALVVSRKLGVGEMEEWINHELNGYGEAKEAPAYRKVRGQTMVWNPYHGYQPLNFGNPEMGELYSRRTCGQSISELEELLVTKKDTYEMPYSQAAQQRLVKAMDVPLRPTLVISRVSIVGIIEGVRNAILEWSLKLEADGVIGEGMTFSDQERARAQASSITYQIENQTVIHGMHGSQIQQGTKDSTQSFVSNGGVEQMVGLVSEIRDVLAGAGLPRESVEAVEADLATIEAQSRSPQPKPGIMKEAIRSVKTVLEGAVGSALGNAAPALPGLIEKIRQIL